MLSGQRRRWLYARLRSSASVSARGGAVRRAARDGRRAVGGARVAAGGGGRAGRARDAGGGRRRAGARDRGARRGGRRARIRWSRRTRRGCWRSCSTSAARRARPTRLRASLGLLSHAFVIGPFGEGRASLSTTFPPEKEPAPPALGARYPGKAHEVGWRLADAAVRDGVFYLDGLLRPADQAVAYVVTFVRSDRDRPAALRLGSPGPVKVWVNGAAVFTNDVVRPAALDQDAVGVRLGRGWNRILIKTVITEGAWRLYARLTDPAGAPLVLEEAPVRRRLRRWRGGRRSRRRGSTRWRARSNAGRGSWGAPGGPAWADLARLLAWTNVARSRRAGRVDRVRARARAAVAAGPDAARGAGAPARGRRRHRRRRRTAPAAGAGAGRASAAAVAGAAAGAAGRDRARRAARHEGAGGVA